MSSAGPHSMFDNVQFLLSLSVSLIIWYCILALYIFISSFDVHFWLWQVLYVLELDVGMYPNPVPVTTGWGAAQCKPTISM